MDMGTDCDAANAVYFDLVVYARASERITPEGLEQVYAMSISVSEADIHRLIAEGELESGTLRPLRQGIAMERSRALQLDCAVGSDPRSTGKRTTIG
jgi:hypothetical protein